MFSIYIVYSKQLYMFEVSVCSFRYHIHCLILRNIILCHLHIGECTYIGCKQQMSQNRALVNHGLTA